MSTDQDQHHNIAQAAIASNATTVPDPVCGMNVEVDKNPLHAEFGGYPSGLTALPA